MVAREGDADAKPCMRHLTNAPRPAAPSDAGSMVAVEQCFDRLTAEPAPRVALQTDR